MTSLVAVSVLFVFAFAEICVTPICEQASATFANDMEVSRIHIGSVPTGDNCKLLISISRCDDTGDGNEVIEVPATESSIIATFDSVEMFYDHDVTVEIDYECDFCGKINIYIPNMKPTDGKYVPSNFAGTIIEDLSNEYCDFNGFVINYSICVNSRGTNECFQHPCGNGKIYTSLCNSVAIDGPVTLQASGVENGTIVSIFCFDFDCHGRFSEVMVFNLQIFTEDDTRPQDLECKDVYSEGLNVLRMIHQT
ncbi:hypothetical protein GBAR_LOCUS13542 [Geodia barretti]|uniref:Uncharacterized protein n=1 Tax=Geodia barretti TaxID=519541 RepID=A0AA35WQP3_GEOBA|nr:hypothetical protein GBAR_LOCUS13542 [Geodia barretti]